MDFSGVEIDLSTKKLLLKTKAEKGNQLRLNFKDSKGDDAGGFILEFSSPPKYGLPKCTGLTAKATKQLKVEIPEPDKSGNRVFEVGKYGSKGLKISCNGTTLLTFEPSKEVCTGWSFWNKAWAKEKKKVTFTFDNVISFYSTAPYTGKTV